MLRQILDSLDAEDTKMIMDAFNNEQTHIVKLPDAKFIAVHYVQQSGDEILEIRGYFTLGIHR